MPMTPGPVRLCALFVDFDNVYLSLKRSNPAAAARFATDPAFWIEPFERGSLITWAKPETAQAQERRIVLLRCYGNPVSRHDDATGFSEVRHHYVRAGFEIVDCPPLTNQLKNGADIRMVMDIRDYLEHQPPIDEFIILSGDADFVPVLHRLRAHARHSVIFASEKTARSYASLCDGTVTDANLMEFLTEGRLPPAQPGSASCADDLCAIRAEIIDEVVEVIRSSAEPVPIEQLAARARTQLGQKRTIGTRWGGYGQFRALLTAHLPAGFELTDQPPYLALDIERHVPLKAAPPPEQPAAAVAQIATCRSCDEQATEEPLPEPLNMKSFITKVLQASRIPPLPAPEYHQIFAYLALEIGENGFIFSQTAKNAVLRAETDGVLLQQDSVQFVLDAVRRSGHWFERDDTPDLLARRFRDYVLAQCINAGMKLSGAELDLIDAWFIISTETEALDDGEGDVAGYQAAPGMASGENPAEL